MVTRTPEGSALPERDPERLLYQCLTDRLAADDFADWFQETPCSFVEPDRFVFTVPNRFRKTWMERHFRTLLLEAARTILEVNPRIEFRVLTVEKTHSQQVRATSRASDARSLLFLAEDPSLSSTEHPIDSPFPAARLHPSFTFENLVVGHCNRVAHAAALAISEQPGHPYNPLYVCGDRGTGKSHLLQALCRRLGHLKDSDSGSVSRLVYMTAETFTRHYAAAHSQAAMEALRAGCRDADVFLLEDLHFFDQKERAQDEFFHTVEALLESGKQVIVSSLASPRETQGLQDRLVSRFHWGLVTRLESPDFETRMAVLKQRARTAYRQELPQDVAHFLARHVSGSFRELEGALARVQHMAKVQSGVVDCDTARSAIQELFEEERTTGTVTMGQILHAVQDYYQVKPKELLSRSKARCLVHARHIGMYLARQLTPLSLEEIGMHFGGRDHSTVHYGLERVEALLKEKPQVRGDVQLLKSRITLPSSM